MHRPDLAAVVLVGVLSGAAIGQTCDTDLISRAPWNWAGNGLSLAEDISDDGRFIVLNTQATDLFDWTSDGNSFSSFLAGHDRLTGNTFAYEGNTYYPGGNTFIVDPISARVANYNAVVFDTLRDYTGNKFRGIYQSGNRVADSNGYSDIYVRSLDIGGVSRVSIGFLEDDANGPSSSPDIDQWGWRVVFQSDASNLIPGDTNGVSDVLRAVAGSPTQLPRLISVGIGGAPANGPSTVPVISAWSGAVAFRSVATNLVADDTNGFSDIFVTDDNIYPTVERVSVATGGGQADRGSGSCAISADGNIVCFSSMATNLVEGDTNGVLDVFVHYRRYGFTRRVSVSSSGEQADLGSFLPGISADGRYAVFSSNASNLVEGDTNGSPDAFVHDLWTGLTTRASLSRSGGQLTGISTAQHSDDTGRYVLFASDASDTGWSDFNGADDAFLRDRNCEIEPFCLADFFFDHIIDTRDFIAFFNAWNSQDPRADSDGNLQFNTRDFIAFLNAWADGC